MKYFTRIFLIFFLITCKNIYAMEIEVSAPKEVFLLIFNYLLPTEKKDLPFVCKHWLQLTTDPQFAQNSFQLFKPLSQKRIGKGCAYFVEESFRLEKKLPEIMEKLGNSRYFFNLGDGARKSAEERLRRKYKQKREPLCLIRNSSETHMIAISFINGRENLSKSIDVSVSENSLIIQPWLNKIPISNSKLPNEEAPQVWMPTDDQTDQQPNEQEKLVPVWHGAVYICEEKESKKIQFIFKNKIDITYDSLILLVEDLKKDWCVIRKARNYS